MRLSETEGAVENSVPTVSTRLRPIMMSHATLQRGAQRQERGGTEEEKRGGGNESGSHHVTDGSCARITVQQNVGRRVQEPGTSGRRKHSIEKHRPGTKATVLAGRVNQK